MWICFSSLIFYQCCFRIVRVLQFDTRKQRREKSKRKDLSSFCDVFFCFQLNLFFVFREEKNADVNCRQKLGKHKLLNIPCAYVCVFRDCDTETLNGFHFRSILSTEIFKWNTFFPCDVKGGLLVMRCCCLRQQQHDHVLNMFWKINTDLFASHFVDKF